MKRISLMLFLAVSITSQYTFACGDNLFRVGKGVSHRVYTAPLPANVLVLANKADAEELVSKLIEAGHSVQVVEPGRELSEELKTSKVDAIIGPYSSHAVVENAKASSGASNTRFLPVAMSRDEGRAAKQSYDDVLLYGKQELKHYLKAIHRAIKQKS